MKKYWIGLILILLTGCSSQPTEEQPNDKLQVYTSFYAMYDFTKTIAGDYADVENLVPPGTEPHDWEPSPGDILKLEQADVLIYSGKGMESWCEKVVSSLSNQDLLAVETAKNVPSPPNQVHPDPHVWLNPANAALQLEEIAAALCKKDPENAVHYQENLMRQLDQLLQLDQKYKEVLSGCQQTEIVVAHKAYGYLCDAYGLEQLALAGIFADGDASPARLSTLIEMMQEKNIRHIFFEEATESDVLKTLQAETGAQALILNPFELSTDNSDYLTVMERNLENLKQALCEE